MKPRVRVYMVCQYEFLQKQTTEKKRDLQLKMWCYKQKSV